MRAVILAGGRGTRLQPHTNNIPKPLVEIRDGETILSILIQQLKKYGFDHITIAVNHLSEQIVSYAGDGSKWGVKIDYSHEEIPLNTIGPLTLIEDLPEHFLTINGDTITDLDYGVFLIEHMNNNRRMSVLVKKLELKIEFGTLSFDKEGKLQDFIEKPTHTYHVAVGVNCYSRAVIDGLSKNTPYGFDQLMKDSIESGEEVYVHEEDSFWIDVGRTEDYSNAIKEYEQIKKLF